MLNAKYNGMSGYLLAAVFLCGIPFIQSATKGQRVLSSPDIPTTQFTCVGRPPGYYADLETGCQVYHMCTEGSNQFSYRCPNTTLFQQRMLICAHWYQVNCSRSEQHYGANLLIGQRDKPFVDDLIYASQSGKHVKTLQNPDSLQNLSHSVKDIVDRSINAQTGSVNAHTNKVLEKNYKRDGESSLSFAGKTTQFQSSFPTTAFPIRTEDLSSLPLAGSVLPGGLKSLQLAHPPNRNSQLFLSAVPSRENPTSRAPYELTSSGIAQKIFQPVSFTPTTTSKPLNQVNFVSSTKSPKTFSTQVTGNSNTFQPIAFETKPLNRNIFQQGISKSQSSFDNLENEPTSDQKQDLMVASQENAYSSRLSTTSSPTFESEGNLPETDVKAIIEPTKNGSLPDDRYNTFIKRFNPYEESSTSENKVETNNEPEPEYHTFINRFVPSFGPPAPSDNSKIEQTEEHVFISRFVLTPEELKREKDRENVNQLHQLQPPDEQLTVNFPNFDLTPPFDDADDSESNKIELHLQDTRRNLFIPDEGDDFSKADAAPIVVTIPLHSLQKSPPMWFKTDKSNDPCARCHPAFITNKDTCLPCVIIR